MIIRDSIVLLQTLLSSLVNYTHVCTFYLEFGLDLTQPITKPVYKVMDASHL